VERRNIHSICTTIFWMTLLFV